MTKKIEVTELSDTELDQVQGGFTKLESGDAVKTGAVEATSKGETLKEESKDYLLFEGCYKAK
ncbi:MAG: bacteriocin [Rhodobiaceae bacterium]|nr:bacteriocin [Rhodobiaceae bacterium]